MHSDLLFSVVLCGKRAKVRRMIMKCKMTGAAGLAGAFVAGMVVATALGGGMVAVGAGGLGGGVWGGRGGGGGVGGGVGGGGGEDAGGGGAGAASYRAEGHQPD